ncbi:MAG: tetratricopeptide repeat protein [Candidatus Yonathbacteria bacterium]|nr:tetratricopeptide repeat protein [Candidatus Yonathbacteria bacterium]
MKTFSLSAIGSWILVAGVFFALPLFFLPAVGLSVEFAKMTLISLVAIVSLILFIVDILRNGELTIPRTRMFGAAGLLFLAVFVAGILSPVMRVSIFGNGSEAATVVGMMTLLVIFALSSFVFLKETALRNAYRSLSIAGGLLAAYQVLNIIALRLGSGILSFGLFTGLTSTPLGSWYDLGAFMGMFVILALVIIALVPKGTPGRLPAGVMLGVSLCMVGLVNFSLVWWILAVFALLLFVFSVSFGRSLHGESSSHAGPISVPFAPIIVLIVATFFLLPGDLDSKLLSQIGVNYTYIRPSWSGTADVVLSTWKTDIRSAVVGSGPNRFSSAWLVNKPAEINNTVVWNFDFDNGVGTIPTFAVTTGILGAIAWILFLGTFVVVGVRGILRTERTPERLYPIVSVFALALYAWIISIVYTPNIVMFAIAFIFTGMLVGILVRQGVIRTFSLSFLRDPRIGFVSVLLLVVVLIGSVIGGYSVVSRFIAGIEFSSGVTAINRDSNSVEGINHLVSAINLYETDTYDRALASAYIGRLSQISEIGNADTAKVQFQETLGNAIAAAQRAVGYDPSSYLNYTTLGDVYATIASVGVAGAYDNAKASYASARDHNPYNPSLFLSLARLEIGQKNIQGARDRIADALALKGDYAGAIFMLSQIEASAGNMEKAIALSEQTALLAPNDIGALFQLGLLHYNKGDYASAILPLERAVRLSPTYANAKYFLGISYDNVGKNSEALAMFEDLAASNPDNKDVAAILGNLKAGNHALAGLEQQSQSDKEAPVDE